SRLKVDAGRNGIAYRDEQGRYADFHALRYTWATFLQRNGIAQRFAMKLMRHSDIKLTAKVYTDKMQLPIYESITNLPRLGCTQIRAQISGLDGQNVAQADANCEGAKVQETVDNGGLCPVLAQTVVKNELERVKGIEPSSQAWEARILPLNHTRLRPRRIQPHHFYQNRRPLATGLPEIRPRFPAAESPRTTGFRLLFAA